MVFQKVFWCKVMDVAFPPNSLRFNAALTQLPSAALTLLLLHSAHCRQWKDLQLLKTRESNCYLSVKFWNAPVAAVGKLRPWLTKAFFLLFLFWQGHWGGGSSVSLGKAGMPWVRLRENQGQKHRSYSRIVSLQDPFGWLLYSLGISISRPCKQLIMVIGAWQSTGLK